MQTALAARGEDLILPEARLRRGKTQELWVSPTSADLRYGEVCIARTLDGTSTIVRISGCRGSKNRPPDKRIYRRWHGIDILGFYLSGERREVRIAHVLKGSRC